MLKKHAILIGILVAITLFCIAAAYYPSGSQSDKNTLGYDWANNYLCNLFSEKAVNGEPNHGRMWAIVGMFFLCVSFARFFYNFSTKVPVGTAANVIRFCGMGAMFFAFLVFSPAHDLMTTLSSVLGLFAVFYVTVFIFRSKHVIFKVLCAACLAILYLNNYIYYTHHGLAFLPILQKISFLIIVVMILGLDYFIQKEDLQA